MSKSFSVFLRFAFVVASVSLSSNGHAVPITFFDDFNRSDGVVGNGWHDTSGNINGNLVVRSGELSASNSDGQAGVYRPIGFSAPVTIGATIKENNGFGGLLRRYDSGFSLQNDGSLAGGYGIRFSRSDQNFNNSTIFLQDNGNTIASIPTPFQFGSQIQTNFTWQPNGGITGTVSSDGNTFSFGFGPRTIQSNGSNLAIVESFTDGRSAVLTHPRVDNFSLMYEAAPAPLPFTDIRQIHLPNQHGTNRVSFDGTQFIVTVDIGLRGEVAPSAIRQSWKDGIEGYWNRNGYQMQNESGLFPIIFRVNFVDSGPVDYQVNVTNTGDVFCQNSSLDWCLIPWIDKAFPRLDMRGAIAAHEFGHLLGLLDEYVGGFVSPGVNPNDLCVFKSSGLSVGSLCNSLMADYGPVQDRYLSDIMRFINDADLSPDFILARAPFASSYPLADPGPLFNGIIEGAPGSNAVSEPNSAALFALLILILLKFGHHSADLALNKRSIS